MRKTLLSLKKPLILDGAMGTELHKAGLPDGECPELWMLAHPEAPRKIQQAYAEAGAGALLVPSFGANRLKLAEFGAEGGTAETNRRLAEITMSVAKNGKLLVGGDIGPTGKMIEPAGDLPFETAVEVFKEQAEALADAGVDFIMVETMMDIQEARAALIAVKESCGLPVIVSMTFSESDRTLSGTTPGAAVVTLQSLGADAVGANCSMGPDLLVPVVREMRKFAKVPMAVKPNAGLPKLVDGETVFGMDAGSFADFAEKLVLEGASVVGGCCGSTPRHIRALSDKIGRMKVLPPSPLFASAVSSSRAALPFEFGRPLRIIGERINPTGKKTFKQELLSGSFKELRKMAVEQEMKGADLLDVNVGAPGCDEKKLLPMAVAETASVSSLPVCIDSPDPEAVEAALRTYPGRALINSISFESKKISKLLPTAARYGAMFILLPLGDGNLPEDSEDRISMILKIVAEAEKHGFTRDDIIVDGLVLTVSANPRAPAETLKTVRWASENGYRTLIGLSNVSFGLPAREKINAAFLSMAVADGLCAAIANPGSDDIMSAKFAADALCGRDESCAELVARFQTSGAKAPELEVKADAGPAEALRQAVLKGDRKHIADFVRSALAAGCDPSSLADGTIIPAIREVGDLYSRKIYFMPQLIMSAEAVKKAFDMLDPLLAAAPGKARTARRTVVLATVKGDIHDIGKNIVGLVLKNHGYEVVDLGKDVEPGRIVEEARKVKADAIGLSALMTTTMPAMRRTVEACRGGGLHDVKFILGGAVVDEEFAESLDAFYAKDAVGAVALLDSILHKDKKTGK